MTSTWPNDSLPHTVQWGSHPLTLHHFKAITTCWLNNNICSMSILISNANALCLQSFSKSLAHVHFNTGRHIVHLLILSKFNERRKKTTTLLHWKIVTVVAPFESIKSLNNVHIECGVHLFLYLGDTTTELINTLAKYFAPIKSSFEWVSSHRLCRVKHISITVCYSVSVTHENPQKQHSKLHLIKFCENCSEY